MELERQACWSVNSRNIWFLVESLGVEIVLLLSLISIIISAEYSKHLTVDEGREQSLLTRQIYLYVYFLQSRL